MSKTKQGDYIQSNDWNWKLVVLIIKDKISQANKIQNFFFKKLPKAMTVGLPPCQACSVSVGENNSIKAPTTSSANCFGNRPVILPILSNYNQQTSLTSKYINKALKTKLKFSKTHFNYISNSAQIHKLNRNTNISNVLCSINNN